MLAEIQIGGHLVLRPVMAPVWAGAVVFALVAVMVLAAWRWPMPLARGRRVLLIVLRALVVVAVAMLLLKPEARWQGRQSVMGEVAFLVDGSRSMAIRDAPLPAEARPDKTGRGTQGEAQGPVRGGSGDPPRKAGGEERAVQALSRRDAVRFAFLAAGKPYADLAARWIINPYAFGVRPRPIGDFAPESADPRTDFAEALGTMVVRQERGTGPYDDTPSPLAAVAVISDGRATRSRGSAEAVARVLAQRGVKVHAVAVGSDTPIAGVFDVAVRDLRAPERVFVGNRPQVRAVVATLGMAGRKVDAVLSVNGKEVARQPVAPASNRTTQELVYTPPLDAAGTAKIALAVEPAPGELIATNNRAETTVRVEEGGIRVLYLDGRLHPEGKYIARALGEAKEIELDRRILTGGAASAPLASDDLDGFSVVILGDLLASAVPPAVTARLAERVKSGGAGLLTLGGLAAYGVGGWAATPLAEVLPFAISANDGQVEGRVRLKLTTAGRQHFIFSLDGAEGLPMSFDALPPLSGASGVGPLHPAARLLAESGDGQAILAVREHARGRAAGLTVDTTWQ
ncbi:MAG: VWA domain-containing protein, partial [Planctomycetota bacterium]|nr:VWA domain-containing protein [Planctomycetota bacterium]